MRPFQIFLALFVLLSLCWSCKEAQPAANVAFADNKVKHTPQIVNTIAFGSCNNQNEPQEMWQYIIQNDPQVWIWMGDNIYGDTEDMTVMKSKYDLLKNNPEYQKLLQQCPVVGTWDDHDYGVNDGDRTYPKKAESKELMLAFLDVSPYHPVHKHEGVYQSYYFGKPGKKIKVILLDTRTFRDPLQTDTTNRARYFPNTTGDVLGEAQWKWLAKELKDPKAKMIIVGSSIQMIAQEQKYEKWGNFPSAFQRFIALLQEIQPVPTLIISGDRHIAELSKLDIDGLDFPLYELTASGLTHTWSKAGTESNANRVGELIIQKNFGLIQIDWSSERPKVSVEVKGMNNETYLQEELMW